MSSRLSPSDGDLAVLTFSGAAFERQVLTRDAVKELDDFLGLVADVAKHLWRRDHPDAKKVPDGFNGRTTPVVGSLLPGSTGALLRKPDASLDPTQAFMFEREPDQLDLSIGAVYRAISGEAVEHELLMLTPAILRGIGRMGSRLPEGSHIGIETVDGSSAVLGDAAKRRLAEIANRMEDAEDGDEDGITILSRIFDQRFGDLPDEVWAEFPADLSEELDHYVHGADKKSGESAQ